MEDPERPTPFEKALIKMLGEHKPDSCLSAEELVELAEQGRRCPEYKERMQHVATCSGCFALFRDVRRMETARAQAGEPTNDRVKSHRLRRAFLLLAALVLAAVCVLALYKFLHSAEASSVKVRAAVPLIPMQTKQYASENRQIHSLWPVYCRC